MLCPVAASALPPLLYWEATQSLPSVALSEQLRKPCSKVGKELGLLFSAEVAAWCQEVGCMDRVHARACCLWASPGHQHLPAHGSQAALTTYLGLTLGLRLRICWRVSSGILRAGMWLWPHSRCRGHTQAHLCAHVAQEQPLPGQCQFFVGTVGSQGPGALFL